MCPKKLRKIVFCQNFFQFPPTLIIFGTEVAKTIKLCEVHSFSTLHHLIIIISEHLYSALSFREITNVLDALSVGIEQKAFKVTLKRVQCKRFVFEVHGNTVPC